MLDFRLLRHFCAIVEKRQIKRAAQRLNITQPTLSLSIKELEENTGFSLINRAGGKWQVTEQERQVYEEGQKILTLLESLNEKIRNPHMSKK